jgi:hypothetical protein
MASNDQVVPVPDAKDEAYHSVDVACSAEFIEGCKFPEETVDDKK